ncbi:SCO family protein [Legionella hackeliae]|uniref:Electron transport protein SCO1/SenC n=1 Tax=Legionella hackeliae TaxID=449 RepID=A0A0A8URS1_LEGHA|nr:SCO family protein [Legionella hackeliae]KTD15197.1 SCO1/SenC family transporter protein [Legionella hackeliae]CEK11438.1 Electron transport protein SCO1/SenC [Legionella hackeliae]STX48210.1 SCO1/SenC family protein [Legionella hackeliae]
MSANINPKTLIGVIALALVAILGGVLVAQHVNAGKKIDPEQFNGTFLETPREINQFALTGIDNQPFNNQSLKGQWTMVFFGFTNCGYLCPTTMSELAKMYRTLEEEGIQPLPRVVMISIDPERDNLEKLDHYVKAFNPHFYGARGTDEIVKQMTHEMGVAYAKIAIPNSNDPNNYDVQHSGAVMLFNPQGELNAFFTTPHQANLLAKDYQLLVS